MHKLSFLRAFARLAGCGSGALVLALHAPANGQAGKQGHQLRSPVAAASVPQSGPSLFGTTAVPIQAKRFSTEWNRASRDASWHPALQKLVAPARGLDRQGQIAFVQRAVHRRIRWRSDATEWGIHDFWASAVQTLERGVGDMEDRAIVKMQALKLLGFPERDLYLTLGRDKVGGPMAVLIVRHANRFYMLDDLGGRPVATDLRQGFTPQLSFGKSAVWAHATRIASADASSAATSPE